MSEGQPHLLTQEEQRWCAELAARLEQEGLWRPPTDFELAQFALVGKGDLKKGLARVRTYNEAIREQFGYDTHRAMDTIASGGIIPELGFYNRKWPGCVTCCPPTSNGHPVVVFDAGKYAPADVDIKSEAEIREMVTDKMLLYDAMSADLNDIRMGCHVVNQAAGAGLHSFSRVLERKLSVVSQDAYPLKFSSMPVYNPGMILSTLMRLARPLLRKKLRDRVVPCWGDELATKFGYRREDLPSSVGGSMLSDPSGYERFIRDRLAVRAESCAKVTLNQQ